MGKTKQEAHPSSGAGAAASRPSAGDAPHGRIGGSTLVQGERAAERYTVRSVARALNMLEMLAGAPRGGCTVTEVAGASGVSKSAAFAVLQTMLAAGFVSDSGSGPNRRYYIGMSLTRLGDLAREQVPLIERARPVLEQVSADLRVSVRLGVLDGNRVSMLDRIDSASGLRIDLRMGDRELLHCTAVGKAILASLTNAVAGELLHQETLARQTPNTIVDLPALLAHLNSIRARGYAIDDEEDFEGIVCIGSALHDGTGAPIGAISVTMLKAGLTNKRITHVGETLVNAAAQISGRLGHVADRRPPDPSGNEVHPGSSPNSVARTAAPAPAHPCPLRHEKD